jgi:hypothetical protein
MKRLIEEINKIKNIMGINEISNELYSYIKNNHKNSRLIMTSKENIKFSEIPKSYQEFEFKPKGLWYAIGVEWVEWVKSNMPEWEKDYIHEIKINENRMIIIRNYDELVAFEEKYGIEDQPRRYMVINWGKVATDYDGIEIAPYIFEARNKHMWYYGWDIASGCIWANGAIQNIEKLNYDIIDTNKK